MCSTLVKEPPVIGPAHEDLKLVRRHSRRAGLFDLPSQIGEEGIRETRDRGLGIGKESGRVPAQSLIPSPQSLIPNPQSPLPVDPADAPLTLDQIEAEHIRRVLASTSTMEEAATKLGIDPSTLYRKCKKYGI